jgi:hypothetical protein
VKKEVVVDKNNSIYKPNLKKVDSSNLMIPVTKPPKPGSINSTNT